MAKHRIFKDRNLSNRELKRRFDDAASSIDQQLDEALAKVDWNRRKKASKSLIDFITTYCIGLMIDDPPSDKFVEALREMEFALSQTRPYNIELPRGQGKTSAAEMAVLYMLATGRRKFCVVVSQNARSAGNILKDIWRPIVEKETLFAQDFPEVCLPFQVCDGAYRRRQLYKMKPTEIMKNGSMIQFARLQDSRGKELPTSGNVITVRGITSGIRGLKVGKLRPDIVILDDLQSSETASNPEQVEKISDIIKKDIMNLSSKGRLAILMTSTPLCPEDLCEKIENDIAWKTTKYPAIIKWPTDMENDKDNGLWAQYFKMYDVESAQDQKHDKSLQFYKDHRAEMDEGALVFSPNRFKPEDGHISGLQALLEKRHVIGDAAFSAEMQMKPRRFSFKLDIKPSNVLSKVDLNSPKYVVPDGFIFVVASTDLNLSYALTTTIVGFKPDMTAHVIHHFFSKCNIDGKMPTAQYNAKVYDVLLALGKQLKTLGIKLNGWGIDASGVPFDAVTMFAKSAMQTVGIPACAMLGRASHLFNPFVRTRLRDAINNTVLCGDAQEHVKAGAGKKYMFWNSDYWRETAQKAFLAPFGVPGSCSLYNGDADEHSDFAIQFCNERLVLVQHKKDGRDIYTWKTKEPHDALDSTAQAYAIAASYGISGSNIKPRIDSQRKAMMMQRRKQKIKIM